MMWGHEITVHIYFEGPRDPDFEDFLIEKINYECPDAHFIGMTVADIEKEPIEQND